MKQFFIIALLVAIELNAFAASVIVKGKVSTAGKGIPSVQITDGTNVVLTDRNGRFKIETSSKNEYIYYSLPSGYNSPIENGIPVFYKKINPEKKKQEIDFELIKGIKPQTNHAFIVWADPQVLDVEEFELLEEVVHDVNKTIATLSGETPLHAISVGDNVFDKLHFFDHYKKVISKIKVPFYQVIGNHDMDFNHRSNELSAKSFSAAFGPTHYSFSVGNVHYVVLKNVFYYGFSYRYIGYIDENQLQWLEKDLQRIKPNSTVVVSLHIPTIFGEAEKPSSFASEMTNSLLNRQALYKILAPFNTHILAGHSHKQWYTQVNKNISEHVHAAASGAWWQGEVCPDGSPKGYTVYQVRGDSLSWYFKGVNKDKTHQFKVYDVGSDKSYPDYFIANVYNYDPLWKVVWYENDVKKGEMLRYWGKDPYAAELYQPGKNKKHGWLSAGNTNNLFRAKPENPAAEIKIEVTDRFGNVYSEVLNKKYKQE